MADCKPKCKLWEDKLKRCEAKLQDLIKINPTKTCLYRMRDWVTCVEAWKIAKGLYIVPVLFAYTPIIGGDWLTVAQIGV